jgi:ABC-2 type transport system permease protein
VIPTRTLRLFGALLAREITMTLHYRWWLAMIQVSSIIAPATSLLVWRGAIALGARPPVSASFLTTYLVLVSIVAMLTSSWTSTFLAASIRLGGLSSWLIRPCSTHLAHLANNAAEKLVKLVLLIPLVACLAAVFRSELVVPADGVRWCLFVVSVLIAAGMTFALDVAIGSLAFWFEDISAIDRLRKLLARILSGALIPLALFPKAVSGFLEAQPFRFMVSFPLEVLLGQPAGGLVLGFTLQCSWFAAFLSGAAITWRLGLRSYQGAGA